MDYTLFIIDDNPWDLKGTAGLIDYGALGISKIKTFENGEEALSAIESGEHCDIILTDIAMPRLNGLQLAKKLKETSPATKVVFMSCYNEFEYIKSALDMNSAGYILKPIEESELKAAIEKAAAIINREWESRKVSSQLIQLAEQERQNRQADYIKDFIFDSEGDEGRIISDFKRHDISLPVKYGICVVVITIDKSYIKSAGNISRYEIYSKLSGTFEEAPSDGLRLIVTGISYREFAAFIIIDLNTKEGVSQTLDEILAHIKLPEAATIGISRVSTRLTDASRLYQEAIQAKEDAFFNPCRRVFGKEAPAAPQDNATGSENLYGDLKKLLDTGDEAELTLFLEKYTRKTAAYQNEAYIKNIAFMILSLTRFIKNTNSQDQSQFYDLEEYWNEINEVKTVTELKRCLCEVLKLYIGEPANTSQRYKEQIVAQIKENLQRSYGKNRTVKSIAREVNFSAVYVNNLFKQATGMTVFEYLTQVRMEKAMELLRKPGSRIYLVADEVGITNKSHFCLAFKKHTGLSPSEYKSKVRP